MACQVTSVLITATHFPVMKTFIDDFLCCLQSMLTLIGGLIGVLCTVFILLCTKSYGIFYWTHLSFVLCLFGNTYFIVYVRSHYFNFNGKDYAAIYI